MSYYFTMIGTRDNPLFDMTFGTSKLGGDGTARFREEAKYMNQFIVHAALDMVEEVQWTSKDLYLKKIDTFQNNHVHCFMTGGNVKFMLLMNPDPTTTPYSSYHVPSTTAGAAGANQQAGGSGRDSSSRPSTAAARQSANLMAANPTSLQTEEAVRQFMAEVYEAWVKCLMNPFYQVNQVVTSPVFRTRVASAAKKYL